MLVLIAPELVPLGGDVQHAVFHEYAGRASDRLLLLPPPPHRRHHLLHPMEQIK